MKNLKTIWLFFIIFIINVQSYVYPVDYGSDTAVSIENPFTISGPSNILMTFACLPNGFSFVDASSTCSFNSIFPVSGPITFKGGTLYLQKDLLLTNPGYFVDMGLIKSQNHAIELPESVTGFATGSADGSMVLSLVSRITSSRNILSVDWSYDGKYVAYGISTGSGSDLYIYEFTGTEMILRASDNLGANGNSVRWRPNSYQLAVAANTSIRTYSFTPPSTLTLVNSQTPIAGGTYYAVSWQGRGNYLALGGTYLSVYSVDGSGNMSSEVTPTNNAVLNGSITYDVLKWAPVGNKNDLIVGTSGGSLHLYNFTGSALNHLKNYPQGIAITSLDWALTSTYMALGFSDGNIKTYQHDASLNCIGNQVTYSSINVSINSLSWRYDANYVAVGTSIFSSGDEFQVLSFDNSDYGLSSAYGINLTTGVNCVRYSPSGAYIARADPSTGYLSIYRASYTSLIFEDTKLYLSGNLTLGAPITFKGNCILNARSNQITLTGDGAINVAKNSSLSVEQAYLNSTASNLFALEGSTSKVSLRNTLLEMEADLLWGDGSFDTYADLTITGPYIFNYSSAYTSTIHSYSSLTLQEGATLKLGKTSLIAKNPLALESDSSQLDLDNATLHVTGSGLQLTKGIIDIYNQSNFVIDNLDNTKSCSLILGDVSAGSEDDLTMRLHGSGTSLSIKSGPIVLNSVSPYKNEFFGQSRVIVQDGASVAIQRPVDLSDAWISADETTKLHFATDSYFKCNNTHFTNYFNNVPAEDYYLTGTLLGMNTTTLHDSSMLNLVSGKLLHAVDVIGSDNLITGFGRVQGMFNFMDSASEVTWDIASPLDFSNNVSLNGGRVIITQDASFPGALTFDTTGTVDLTHINFEFGAEESLWDGNIYWVGDGGNLTFQNNVTLSGIWTFSGRVILNGSSNSLLFASGGRIVLERGAQVTFKDLLINNLSDDNSITCMDDSCQINFYYTKIALGEDYRFEKGSFLIHTDTWITSLGNFDNLYTFSYDSMQTSTISEMGYLKIGPKVRFSIGRQNSSISDPNRQPLIFVDSSSPLILDNGTLHITSSGIILTKGLLEIFGNSHLEIENPKYDYALILGDGINSYNDQVLQISAGSKAVVDCGRLIYNNCTVDKLIFDSPESALDVLVLHALTPLKNLKLTYGLITTPLATDNFLEYVPNTFLTAENFHRYDHGHTLEYYVTGTLALMPDRTLVLDCNDQILTNPGDMLINIGIRKSGNLITGVGNIISKLNFTDSNSTLTWDINRKYSGGDIDLNGGKIIFTQDTGLVDGYSIVGTGTVDLTTVTFELGTEVSSWNSDIYWIGDGGILKIPQGVNLSGTWTFSGNVVIDACFQKLLFEGDGKIVLEKGAHVVFRNILFENLSDANPIVCGDNNCLISFDRTNIALSGDYKFNNGSFLVCNDSWITSLGDFDNFYTFSYDSIKTSTISEMSYLKVGPRTRFSIGRDNALITDPNRQPLVFADATSPLILDGGTLHITSSGMILTRGLLKIQENSHLEIENAKYDYALVLGDGVNSNNDYVLQISAGSSGAIETGRLVYNNCTEDKIIFDSPESALDVVAQNALSGKKSFILKNGSVTTPNPTDVFIPYNPNILVIGDNLHRYDYGHLIDYYVTGTLAVVPNRTIILDSGGKLLTNPGSFGVNLSIVGAGNQVLGVGNVTGKLSFVDNRSTLTWDINQRYAGGNIDLNGGRIIIAQDSGLTEQNSFVGTGTVDIKKFTFDLGNDETTWNSHIYWIGDGGTLKLNNNIALSGTWTFSGEIVVEGNSFWIDLAQSGKIELERGAKIRFKDISLFDVSDNNPIICSDDTSSIYLNNSKILLSGNYNYGKGSFVVCSDSSIGNPDNMDSMHTFSYSSVMTSTINSFCVLSILEGTTFAVGRHNSSVVAPERQSIVFEGVTSKLLLDGGTLYITSSGLGLTRGILGVKNLSSVEIDSSKPEYALVIGNGTAIDDFSIEIESGAQLLIQSGVLFYNDYRNDGIIFDSPASSLSIVPVNGIVALRDLVLMNGSIYSIGTVFARDTGGTIVQDNMTRYYQSPYHIEKVKSHDIRPNKLFDGDYFYAIEGTTTRDLIAVAGVSSVGGNAAYDGNLSLVNDSVFVHVSMNSQFSKNIVLNGGTLIVDNNMLFASDKKMTGSGTIQMPGTELSFGAGDKVFTDTLFWVATAPSRISLDGKTKLFGTWNLNGDININGNGNELDLSCGGALLIRPNSVLTLENVVLSGLGEEFGHINFIDDGSILRLSNSYLELDGDFSTTIGGIYVYGPTTLGLKNFNWTLDQKASMTIDGVTLWQDALGQDGGKITYGAGDMSKYLSLVSSGTVKTVTNSDVISVEQIQAESAIRYNSNSIVRISKATECLCADPGARLYLSSGILGSRSLNGLVFLMSPINLNGGTLTIDADMHWSSDTTILSPGGFLNPCGHAFVLGGDLIIPSGTDLQFTTSGIIDGQGHNLIFEENSKLVLDNYITLTLRNITLHNVKDYSDGNSSISNKRSFRTQLVLENTKLYLGSTYSFTSGQLYIHGDVVISGTNQFNYTSTSCAFITNDSALMIDRGMTFSYGPLSVDRELIKMTDATSILFLNGCTLNSTTTGMILKNGTLILDNKNYLYNQDRPEKPAISLSEAIVFGDENFKNDLGIEVLPGASLDVKSGILDYRNVN